MNSNQLCRLLEEKAQGVHGEKGRTYPEVVVVTEEGEWTISEIGLGDPGQIVIFVTN